jgi:hypothetical protein
MKYTFTINQVAAVELGDVDAVDCLIIEWLRDICISQAPAVKQERKYGYTWVNYQFAVNDMPLLKFKDKSAFRHRVARLVEKGYFKAKKMDQRAYLKPLPKMDLLFKQPGNQIPGHASNRGYRSPVPGNQIPGSATQTTGVNRGYVSPNPNPNTNTLRKPKNLEAQKPQSVELPTSRPDGLDPHDPKVTRLVRERIREELRMRQASKSNAVKPSTLFKQQTVVVAAGVDIPQG